MKTINIGILGIGTVGGGTITVLTRNAEEIARRTGAKIEILLACARDLTKQRAAETEGIALTDDPYAIVNHEDIDIVCELIGGTELARDMVLIAIANGKHVVTANKALIATHGNEIFQAAKERGVMVAYEAAVAGGIPVIKAIREGMSANRINAIAGIINGTGNYILTAMHSQGRDFKDVLQEAQELGYAEADPTFDVEGIDAAHKLTILASTAFGMPLKFKEVYTEGISAIRPEDLENADRLGYHIKHLGIAKSTKRGVEMRVHPALVPKSHLLASVNGVMNAVVVTGDAVGQTLYYGAGAGAGPTASAVVSDIVDVIRNLQAAPESWVPALAFQTEALNDSPIMPMDSIESAYYLNTSLANHPGTLDELISIFARHDISIEAIKQNESDRSFVPVTILTRRVQEANINQAIEEINALSSTEGEVRRIRVETLA